MPGTDADIVDGAAITPRFCQDRPAHHPCEVISQPISGINGSHSLPNGRPLEGMIWYAEKETT